MTRWVSLNRIRNNRWSVVSRRFRKVLAWRTINAAAGGSIHETYSCSREITSVSTWKPMLRHGGRAPYALRLSTSAAEQRPPSRKATVHTLATPRNMFLLAAAWNLIVPTRESPSNCRGLDDVALLLSSPCYERVSWPWIMLTNDDARAARLATASRTSTPSIDSTSLDVPRETRERSLFRRNERSWPNQIHSRFNDFFFTP